MLAPPVRVPKSLLGPVFTTALELVEELELAEMKGELKRKVGQLCRFDLLVIDELGYLPAHRQVGLYLVAADTSEKLHHRKQEVSDGTEETTVQSRVQRGSGRARESA